MAAKGKESKPSEPRHKITLFGVSAIMCKCGWKWRQAVMSGDKKPKLQDKLLDAYNSHIINVTDSGRGE